MPDASLSSRYCGSGSSANRSAANGCRGGIRERDRLGLVVARESPGTQHVDIDTVHRVAQLAGSRDALLVTFSKVSALELLEMLLPHHEVDIHLDSSMTVLVQRECADDRVGNVLVLEDLGQPV